MNCFDEDKRRIVLQYLLIFVSITEDATFSVFSNIEHIPYAAVIGANLLIGLETLKKAGLYNVALNFTSTYCFGGACSNRK